MNDDKRPFKPVSEGINPRNGRSWVIHEGVAQPNAWDDYFHESNPLAVEVLNLRGAIRGAAAALGAVLPPRQVAN